MAANRFNIQEATYLSSRLEDEFAQIASLSSSTSQVVNYTSSNTDGIVDSPDGHQDNILE